MKRALVLALLATACGWDLSPPPEQPTWDADCTPSARDYHDVAAAPEMFDPSTLPDDGEAALRVLTAKVRSSGWIILPKTAKDPFSHFTTTIPIPKLSKDLQALGIMAQLIPDLEGRVERLPRGVIGTSPSYATREPARQAATMAHEYQHLLDAERMDPGQFLLTWATPMGRLALETRADVVYLQTRQHFGDPAAEGWPAARFMRLWRRVDEDGKPDGYAIGSFEDSPPERCARGFAWSVWSSAE